MTEVTSFVRGFVVGALGYLGLRIVLWKVFGRP